MWAQCGPPRSFERKAGKGNRVSGRRPAELAQASTPRVYRCCSGGLPTRTHFIYNSSPILSCPTQSCPAPTSDLNARYLLEHIFMA